MQNKLIWNISVENLAIATYNRLYKEQLLRVPQYLDYCIFGLLLLITTPFHSTRSPQLLYNKHHPFKFLFSSQLHPKSIFLSCLEREKDSRLKSLSQSVLLGSLQDVHYKVARKADRANHRQKTTHTAGNFPLPLWKQAPRHLILAPCKEQRRARTHPQPGVIWHQALSESFHEPNQHAAPLQPRRRILYLLWITLSDVHTASEQVMSLLRSSSKCFKSSLHLLFGINWIQIPNLTLCLQPTNLKIKNVCLHLPLIFFVQFYKKIQGSFAALYGCFKLL